MAHPSKQMRVTLLPEEALERLAHIVGDHSAARLALDDMTLSRARGEDPVAVQHGESILVVPRGDLIPADPQTVAPSTEEKE